MLTDTSCQTRIGQPVRQLPRLGANWANLMLNNIFTCNGNLTELIYFRGSDTGSAFVGIWTQIDEHVFILKSKVELPQGEAGLTSYVLPRPLAVKRGDLIGIHYSRYQPSGIIYNTLISDNAVSENELYQTVNVELFDEDIETGEPIDVRDYAGEMLRKTFALQGVFMPETDTLPTNEPYHTREPWTPYPTQTPSFSYGTTSRPSPTKPPTWLTTTPEGKTGKICEERVKKILIIHVIYAC